MLKSQDHWLAGRFSGAQRDLCDWDLAQGGNVDTEEKGMVLWAENLHSDVLGFL